MLGSGVLNEAISPATPTGRRTVETARWAMLADIVRPYERLPSPATKKPISIAASVSPSARSIGLPVSSMTTAESSSRRSRSASAISRMSSPRSTGVRSAQAGCARRAASTAASTSRAPERAKRHSIVPSAGRSLSIHSPDDAGRALPSIRFGISSGITRPTSRRRPRDWRRSRKRRHRLRGRQRRRRTRRRRPFDRRGSERCTRRRTRSAARSRLRRA